MENNYEYDSVVESVINRLKDRARIGFEKYGTDLDRNDLITEQWIEHAIEEALDFSLYLTKLKNQLKKSLSMFDQANWVLIRCMTSSIYYCVFGGV